MARLRGPRAQVQVSQQGALPAAQWSIYESGRRLPSPETLEKILRGLGCSEEILFDEVLRARARRLHGEDKGAPGPGVPAEEQSAAQDVQLLVTELKSLRAQLVLLSTYFVGLDRRIQDILGRDLPPRP